MSSSHTPFDKRVFAKEAVSLVRAGFDVVHLAPGEGERFREKGVEIATHQSATGLWKRLLQIPRLYRLAVRENADCYHCNEVETWLVGILLKLAQRKRKVVFDVHEHYPSRFEEGGLPRWLCPLAASGVRLLFNLLVPFTDRLILAKRSVAIDFQGSEAKQVLVQNFAPASLLKGQSTQNASPATNSYPNCITAIHLGLISRARGWPQLLDAFSLVQATELRLHIIGTFSDNTREEFSKRTQELGLNERAYVEGWMPFEQAFERIVSAHIGLVPFQPGITNHVYALPHKMFDYMVAGLPLIVPAFAEEVAAIVKESDCGLLVDPSDPVDIAQALDYLASHPEERQRLGENGRRAVQERYNWETEAKKLIETYKELAKPTPGL